MNQPLSRVACVLLMAGVVACGNSEPVGSLAFHAATVLPPGQSGFFSAEGQAAGSASGQPGDYGEHVDDQRLLFWNFGYKDGRFDQPGGTPLPVPRPGVDVVLDAYGVPSIHADTVYDLWYGAGYVAGQQRLFLMDAVRRLGRGTAAALFGCGYVPGDIQTRTLTYTDAEYAGFFARLSPDAKAAFEGYAAGANAWRDQVMANPDLLPAEYQLLSATPEPFEVIDFLAAGVFMTRRVAAEGGDEFYNVRMLRALEQAYGKAQGRAMFLDLVWDEDRKAVTTVPRDAEFPNQAVPAGGREAAFHARADWATTLPDTIWLGPGTAASAEPAPCSGGPDPVPASAAAAPAPTQFAAVPQKVAGLLDELDRFHGGSWAAVIGRSRTAGRGALLISAPQLGYTYPSYLWEAEIHGAGYHARGVSVPGLPVIGIGYTPDVAWALTSGYSKSIDSFIETICSTAQQQAGTCAADQYFHGGAWKDMACREETVFYRAASDQGIPYGPGDLQQPIRICRTVHGPVAARDDDAGLARSLSFAMWMHEVDTVEGVREWNRAKSLADFMAATRKVTWNENVLFATRHGDIGFVHPGRMPDRAPEADQRLPTPGTGAFDHRGWLPFERLPQSINPAQGFLANWNNKPALGWLDGEGMGITSRPGGPGQRVTILLDAIAARSDWSYADLEHIDRTAGMLDPRAREYLPVLELFYALNVGALSDAERHAVDLILRWDRRHYGPDVTVEDPASRDSAAATIFDAWVNALRRDLFGALEQHVLYAGDRDLDKDGDPDTDLGPDDPFPNVNIYNRSSAVGSHRFDQSVMDNLILRVLRPASSSLAARHDWRRGRSVDAVLRTTLRQALADLAAAYGTGNPPTRAEVEQFRRVHPKRKICSLTGAIGPGSDAAPGTSCVEMPYQDRGSWVHFAGWE